MAYARQRLVRAPPSPPTSPSPPQPLSCAPPPRIRRPLRVVSATHQFELTNNHNNTTTATATTTSNPPARLAVRKVRPIIRGSPSAPVPVPGRNPVVVPSENDFYVGSPAAARVFMAPPPPMYSCASSLPRSMDSCDSLNAITPS